MAEGLWLRAYGCARRAIAMMSFFFAGRGPRGTAMGTSRGPAGRPQGLPHRLPRKDEERYFNLTRAFLSVAA